MCICALFVGCEKIDNRDECTLVTIDECFYGHDGYSYEFEQISIIIYNAKGKKIGSGSQLGSYLVPHNGYMSLYWNYSEYYEDENSSYSSGGNSGYGDIYVETTYEIECCIDENGVKTH